MSTINETKRSRFSARGTIVLDNDYANTPLHILCTARSAQAADHIRRAMNRMAVQGKLGRVKKINQTAARPSPVR